jgi:site-specific recombinase XerD
MHRRSKHTVVAIEEEDILLFQAGWSKTYKSKQTRRSVRTRYREFFRYCKKKKWIDDVPDFDVNPSCHKQLLWRWSVIPLLHKSMDIP